MDRNLWCVARGRNHEWEAFCLDFDLAVQGRSFEEVISLLKEAIQLYVQTAMHEAEPARSALLSRAAPFGIKLAWRLRIALWALFARKRAEESTFGFPLSCHA